MRIASVFSAGATRRETQHAKYVTSLTEVVITNLLRQVDPDSLPIELGEGWGIPGTSPLELRDPRLLAMAAAQHHFLGVGYDESAAANSNGASCCRSAVLILMALTILRHTLAMAKVSADGDASMLFTRRCQRQNAAIVTNCDFLKPYLQRTLMKGYIKGHVS